MARSDRFTFVCNQQERQLVEHLAKRLYRSQSDAVRFAIRKVARELTEEQEDCSSENPRAGVGGGGAI